MPLPLTRHKKSLYIIILILLVMGLIVWIWQYYDAKLQAIETQEMELKLKTNKQ